MKQISGVIFTRCELCHACYEAFSAHASAKFLGAGKVVGFGKSSLMDIITDKSRIIEPPRKWELLTNPTLLTWLLN